MLIFLQMIETPQEKSKFEILYQQYRNLMFSIASQILKNDQDAEDAVHQAFVKIAENIKKIDEPISPQTKSYVVTIAENKAIDLYRKRQRHMTIALTEEVHGLEVNTEGIGDLAGCILKLPGQYREMILLRYHHGYSIQEIAKMMGISVSAANKLNQRAKNRLRDLCREEGLI